MNFTKNQKIFIVFIIISILAIGLIYFVLIPKQKTKSIQPPATDEKTKQQQEICDDLQLQFNQKAAEIETSLQQTEEIQPLDTKEKKIRQLCYERAIALVELDEISRNRRKASEKLENFHYGQSHRPSYVDECINPECLKNLEIRNELKSKFNELCKKRQSIDQQITQLQGQDQQ